MHEPTALPQPALASIKGQALEMMEMASPPPQMAEAIQLPPGHVSGAQAAAFALLVPARMAFTVDIVGPRLIPNAVALAQISMNSNRVVGPAIAVYWGWVPAVLWVLFGTIFFAGVHDFGAIWASARHKGKSIGALSEEVIGSRTRYVEEADALDHVAGYCVFNDVSERHYQLEGTGQWVKGKSADTFAPFGPWMVTRDEIPDPQDLHVWLEVDGKRYQDGSTRTMIFPVAHLVSYVSRYMTLEPGDIIPTGTPPGVGLGQKPAVFLEPGNVMRLGIEGLGEMQQRVLAHPDE